MLKIIQAPNSILSAPAKPIIAIDKSIKRLIKDMEEALIVARDPEGVGLAAPQVGKSLRMFLVKQTPRSPTLVFINPVIEKFIGEMPINTSSEEEENNEVALEGCLSLYSTWGKVNRYPGIILTYIDEAGKTHKKKFEGFLATIIQHECDHLQGILFPKRVLEQKGELYKSSKNEKGENVFEKIEI